MTKAAVGHGSESIGRGREVAADAGCDFGQCRWRSG